MSAWSKGSLGTVVGAVLAFVAVILGSGCAAVPLTPVPAGHEPILRLYPGAESASKGFLMVDKNESTQDFFTIGGTNPLVSLQDYPIGKGSSVEIRSKPLEANYYINRSVPLYGQIYWRSVTSAAGATGGAYGAETEWMKLRVELFAGSTRVGGDEFAYQPVYHKRPTEWTSLDLNFRSEATVLPKGEVLSLKITRFGGLTDISISTDDPARSYILVRYYSRDVYQGPIIIDSANRVQLPAVEDVPEDGDLEEMAFVGLAALPLVGLGMSRLTSRHRLVVLGVVLVFLSVSLAGCFGGGPKGQGETSDTQPGSRPTFETSVIENETLREQGVGGVQGRVRDYDQRTPIVNAKVSLIGAPNFAVTDARGQYDLGAAVAGIYTLRIDHERYSYYEASIEVLVGKVLVYNVSMRSATAGDESNAHIHNEYEDKEFLDLGSFTVPLVGTQGADACTFSPYDCGASFTLPPNKYIPPGTSILQITATWPAAGSYPVKDLGLVLTTAAATEARLVPRSSGDPFRLALQPNEADPGHSKMTYWTFKFSMHNTPTLLAPFDGQWLAEMPDVTVNIRTFRGAIPFEPAHKDFWGKDIEKKVFKADAKSYNTAGIVFPSDSTNYKWTPAAQVYIPPATDILKGELTWAQQYNNVAIPLNSVEWTLLYKPANVPKSLWAEGLKPVKVERRETGKLVFTITPTENEVDQYYQKASNWVFYLDDGLDRHNVEGLYTQFTLTLTAHKKA